MRVTCRRLLVSAAVVVGLFVPAVPAAIASPDSEWSSTAKQTQMRQMTDRARTQSNQPTPAAGWPFSRLAVERDNGRVVLALKVRHGSRSAAVALAAVAGAARAEGGKQRRTLRQLDTVTVEVPQAEARAFTARMRDRSDVLKVELVPRRSLSLVPNDVRYAVTAPYLSAVSAPAAWDVHQGDPSLQIAVVDSGVDVNHPDLAGRVAGTYNAVTGGTDVTDTEGHGTFVAGVAAATANNGIGIAGASMGSSVLAVKVTDAQDNLWADDEVAGILWAADHGARIINLSLGGATSIQTEKDAVAYAVGKGILVVAAAGNEASTTPYYPAAYPQVVAVGATDAAGRRAMFSSFGPWVTVAAPGIGITGTTPTGGSTSFQPDYDVADGTSFSSPIVAAEAALLWSLRPAVSSADIRQAIVRSSHGYAGLGLGAGQVDFRAAYDALRPDSVPVLTQPVEGASVTGVLQLSATSTAPKVRFLVNGTALGAPVATSAGTASTRWTSWGAANGPRTVTAVDCSISDLCNTQASQSGVTLENLPPVLTSPVGSQTLTGTATFTATAPGGGVAFNIDGVRRGFDASAPYALTYPLSSLANGRHTVQAVSCSTSGTACAGPASALVSFTASSLHPRITAVSPSVFSPNGDGRLDTTRMTYYLPDTEAVVFQVRNAAGTIVRGPSGAGTLGAGTRTLIWNGLLNNRTRAANGTYTLELATSRGTLRGSAVARVVLDAAAPTMTSITGGATTFYPYPDYYRDIFTPRFALSERATVTLTVRTSSGALVSSLGGTRYAGATSMQWNGKNASGARVAAGTYYWILTAQDAAGNRRASARYGVVVNARHLVTRTATVSRRGSQYLSAGGNADCASTSKSPSEFYPYGVWLANGCPSTGDVLIAAATHRFTVPAAVSYSSLRLDSYGSSLFAPSTLGVGFTRWATRDHTFREITVGGTNAWRTLGSVAPAGLVSSGSRQVETILYVPNDYDSSSDYDVSHVRLVVTYKVLG